MIIAPLMQPIGAMAYGLATTHRRLLLQATLTMVAGGVFVVAIAYLATLVVGVHTVGQEIVGRTAPTMLDLVVAIAAGTAGAFAATRRSVGNAIPGVAIAVALVPPLCVVGLGLALGTSAIPEVGLVLNQRIAVGASLLFLANLAGIVFSGALVFVVQGYGRWSRALRGIVVSLAVIVGLAFPLSFALEELLARNTVHRHLVALRYERSRVLPKHRDASAFRRSRRRQGPRRRGGHRLTQPRHRRRGRNGTHPRVPYSKHGQSRRGEGHP